MPDQDVERAREIVREAMLSAEVPIRPIKTYALLVDLIAQALSSAREEGHMAGVVYEHKRHRPTPGGSE
jgi:hypothetical protein